LPRKSYRKKKLITAMILRWESEGLDPFEEDELGSDPFFAKAVASGEISHKMRVRLLLFELNYLRRRAAEAEDYEAASRATPAERERVNVEHADLNDPNPLPLLDEPRRLRELLYALEARAVMLPAVSADEVALHTELQVIERGVQRDLAVAERHVQPGTVVELQLPDEFDAVCRRHAKLVKQIEAGIRHGFRQRGNEELIYRQGLRDQFEGELGVDFEKDSPQKQVDTVRRWVNRALHAADDGSDREGT
jgi:hypothetical protein